MKHKVGDFLKLSYKPNVKFEILKIHNRYPNPYYEIDGGIYERTFNMNCTEFDSNSNVVMDLKKILEKL
jgi:hypothetical protein